MIFFTIDFMPIAIGSADHDNLQPPVVFSPGMFAHLRLANVEKGVLLSFPFDRSNK